MKFIQSIETPSHIAGHYSKLSSVLGRFDIGQKWISKQTDWIAVPIVDYFYEEANEKKFIEATLRYGHHEVIALAWEDLKNFPPAFIVPSTMDALEEFNRKCRLFWFVLFAGAPDWFVLCTRLEYLIVAGKPDFVTQVIGCQPNESFAQFQEFIESDWPTLEEKEYLSNLLQKLQYIYPEAESGTIIWL